MTKESEKPAAKPDDTQPPKDGATGSDAGTASSSEDFELTNSQFQRTLTPKDLKKK